MILKYLLQSYPMVENRWRIVLPISAFICLFMVIFQPFGLSAYKSPDKYIVLAGYGLVTFLILIFNLFLIPAILPSFFKEKTYVVWKELLFFLWILFTIGLGNLIYTSLFFHLRLTFSSVLTIQLFTLAIGVIPITIITIVKQNYLYRKYSMTADQLSSALHPQKVSETLTSSATFMSDNGKDELSIPVSDLLAIDAERNYITIFYLTSGKPHSALLRNTLSYAEEVVSSYPGIFKCHRSFLVNIDWIVKVNGNSQGYRLVIDGVPDEIPVSRGNASRLKELLSA